MGRGIKAGKKKKIDKKIRNIMEARTAYEKQKIVDSVTNDMTELIMYQHNIDMIAVMFALRDEFQFGKSRLIRVLKRASEHADNMFVNKMDVDEMLAILEEETGVKEEDLIFTHEVEVLDDAV